MQGHRLGLAAVKQTGALGAGYVERVGDAAEALRNVEWTVAPLPARVGERDEMSCQIAAVDGGYVSRLQGSKISRVVPIQEVTAHALQASHRRKRRLKTIN